MSASKLQAQDKDNSHFFQLIRKIQGFPDPVSEYWEALCDTYKKYIDQDTYDRIVAPIEVYKRYENSHDQDKRIENELYEAKQKIARMDDFLMQERRTLLNLYKNTNKDGDRVNKQLSVKSTFISSKNIPEDKKEEYIDRILTELDFLFTETDREYRSSRINRENIKDHNTITKTLKPAKRLEIPSPKNLGTSNNVDNGIKLAYYRARLNRLRWLKAKFKEDPVDILRLKEQGIEYFDACAESNPEPQKGEEVYDLILNYFQSMGRSLLDSSSKQYNKEQTIKNRILRVEEICSPNFRPVMLTYMTACCNRRLALEIEVKIPQRLSYKGTRCNSLNSKMPENVTNSDNLTFQSRKSRCAQIELLNELCTLFLSEKEQWIENIQQFLFWSGKEINSSDEQELWRNIFKNQNIAYEDIPWIGFQLCVADYRMDCLPLNLQTLVSDSLFSTSLKGGYAAFWKLNQEKIEETAKDFIEKIEKIDINIINKYKRSMSDPRSLKVMIEGQKPKRHQFLENTVELLEAVFPMDLTQYTIPEQYGQPLKEEDEKELKRMLLETLLRVCIKQRATKKMEALCIKAYNFRKFFFRPLKERSV